MKCLLLLLFALPACAADHVFLWTPNDPAQQVTLYRICEQTGTPPVWVPRVTVPGSLNTATISNVAQGWHVYAADASNAFGLSTMSQPVSAFVPALPTPPTNVIVNLRAEVQGAASPGGPWWGIAQFSLPVISSNIVAFYRTRMEALQ